MYVNDQALKGIDMVLSGSWTPNGYYGIDGRWVRTKLCIAYCGSRCNCGPPLGVWYSPVHDRSNDRFIDEKSYPFGHPSSQVDRSGRSKREVKDEDLTCSQVADLLGRWPF